MSWLKHPRILELLSAALPAWQSEEPFTVSRLPGTEKPGTVEVAATPDAPGRYVGEAQRHLISSLA